VPARVGRPDHGCLGWEGVEVEGIFIAAGGGNQLEMNPVLVAGVVFLVAGRGNAGVVGHQERADNP